MKEFMEAYGEFLDEYGAECLAYRMNRVADLVDPRSVFFSFYTNESPALKDVLHVDPEELSNAPDLADVLEAVRVMRRCEHPANLLNPRSEITDKGIVSRVANKTADVHKDSRYPSVSLGVLFDIASMAEKRKGCIGLGLYTEKGDFWLGSGGEKGLFPGDEVDRAVGYLTPPSLDEIDLRFDYLSDALKERREFVGDHFVRPSELDLVWGTRMSGKLRKIERMGLKAVYLIGAPDVGEVEGNRDLIREHIANLYSRD
jgi:hypothetical protein